jgi:glutathionylspermidine synthase
MQRIACSERDDWQQTAEACGFDFHTIDGERYWDERGYYAFTLEEIEEKIEAPTGEIDAMCLELAARAVDDEQILTRLKIPEAFWPLISASWHRDEPSLYGRLDLFFDRHGPAKLLEYNADTPTSIFEAAVFQWTWLEQAIERAMIPTAADQYNSIHEQLIEAWKKVGRDRPLHLTGLTESSEDYGTLAYLEDAATQAGLATTIIDIADVGWREGAGGFVDLDNRDIPGNGCSTTPSAPSSRRRRPAGSSRPGKRCSPTRASCPCCGRCFPAIRTCCRRFSRTIRTRRGLAPAMCASRFIRARAPM